VNEDSVEDVGCSTPLGWLGVGGSAGTSDIGCCCIADGGPLRVFELSNEPDNRYESSQVTYDGKEAGGGHPV